MRTLEWNYQENHLEMIDQRLLPGELKMVELKTYQEVAIAITDMVVRGAPAIGASAGFGMALAAFKSKAVDRGELLNDLSMASEYLFNSRPTAVNLEWALKRMMSFSEKQAGSVQELKAQILEEAQRIADEDVEINKRMSENGAALIQPGETVIHHCNTGALATVDWGTALGVIRTAHEQGKNIKVLVDETRPRLQGSRLTAWELERYEIPYHIISDNSAGYFLSKGEVQRVFVGADRVAANGDTVNKIGTYMLALAAKDNNVPFYVVAPSSTIDFELSKGDRIPIEERDEAEVLDIQRNGKRLSPKGAHARNPAFDLTPKHLITGIVTEHGVIEAPFDKNLAKLKELRK
jgi:methylthioribose-1-phosphate isomerase